MTDETENPVVELLRRIRDDGAGLKSEVREEPGALKLRWSGVDDSPLGGWDKIGRGRGTDGPARRAAEATDA